MNVAKVKVWDPAVRIIHWSLVIFFTIAYLTGEEAGNLHNNAGYIVLGLVAFRLLWGFIGTEHARFRDFLYRPAATIAYAKSMLASKPVRYLGHNPLGGWMIVALLASLLITCWSGMEYIGSEGKGPLAADTTALIAMAMADEEHGGDDEEEGDEFWEEVHEIFANLTLALAFIHIAGVIVVSGIHRENLVSAMITGDKDKEPD